MRTCPECLQPVEDEARFCGGCGSACAAPAEVPPDPFIGRTINGKFKVEAQIGQGGMGKVYRVVEKQKLHVGALLVLHLRRVGFDCHSLGQRRLAARHELAARGVGHLHQALAAVGGHREPLVPAVVRDLDPHPQRRLDDGGAGPNHHLAAVDGGGHHPRVLKGRRRGRAGRLHGRGGRFGLLLLGHSYSSLHCGRAVTARPRHRSC